MSAASIGERRPEWPPIVVALSCCVVIFAALVVADRPAWSTDPGSDFVPADGSAAFTATEAGVTGATGLGRPFDIPAGIRITESARTSVVQAAQSTSSPLADALLHALNGRLDVPIWRTISRPAGSSTGEATTDGSPTADADRVAFYRIDSGIALLASGGPTGVRSFLPALRMLNADPRPGQSWTDAGTVTAGNRSARYDSSFRVVSLTHGCAAVRGKISIDGVSGDRTGTSDGSPTNGTIEVSQTWCRGTGLASQTVGDDQGTSTTRTVVAPGPPPAAPSSPGTTDTSRRWQHPADWRSRSITPVTVRAATDGSQGRTDAMQGTPAALPPVLTSSGLLIRAGQQGNDLVVLGGDDDGHWTVRGRLHPGGTATALVATGPMIIVGTTQRQLIGYSSDGVRRWQIGLDDVVVGQPVVVGNTLIAATVGGTVLAVDIARGTVSWRQQVGDVLATRPAAASDTVAVTTASATVIALDLQTGSQRWQVDRETVGSLIGAGSQFVVADGRGVHGYDARTGRHRWSQAVSSTVGQLLPVGSDILVQAHDSTVMLNAVGRRLTSTRAYTAISGDGTDWIGWRSGAADLYTGAQGGARPVRSYPLPQLAGSFDPRPVSSQNGSLIFGGDWTFVELGLPR